MSEGKGGRETPQPSAAQIERWIFDVEMPQATDGCEVELDGICPHGCESWMLALGLI